MRRPLLAVLAGTGEACLAPTMPARLFDVRPKHFPEPCYTRGMTDRALTMRTLARLLPTLVCLCSLCANAFAQDSAASATQYDVELIIFQHLASNASAEDWALEEALMNRGKPGATDSPALPESAVALGDNAPALQALPPEQLKLSALAASLRNSRNYRVLAHLAWAQAPVALRSDAVTLLTPLLPADSAVSGSAKLSRGTTLNLSVDLRLHGTEGANYVLKQTRQMKLGERHYFDHPQFGVIAAVNARRP